MGQTPPPNKPDIDDNIRRTVERTALRKVRGVLDTLEREEQDERRFRQLVFTMCGVLVFLLIVVVAFLILL